QGSLSTLGQQINQIFKTSVDQMTNSIKQMSAIIKNSVEQDLPGTLYDFRMMQISMLATLYLDESTIPISLRMFSEDDLQKKDIDSSGIEWYKNLLEEKDAEKLARAATVLLGGMYIDNNLAVYLNNNGFFVKADKILYNYGPDAYLKLKQMVEG
ncbi:MAG: hypothetical protein ACP5NC_05895, partial [Nitrososphaeria archaeon]